MIYSRLHNQTLLGTRFVLSPVVVYSRFGNQPTINITSLADSFVSTLTLTTTLLEEIMSNCKLFTYCCGNNEVVLVVMGTVLYSQLSANTSTLFTMMVGSYRKWHCHNKLLTPAITFSVKYYVWIIDSYIRYAVYPFIQYKYLFIS